MKKTTRVKKNLKGRPKTPELKLLDLSKLKKIVKEIKKRKSGIYRRWQKK